MFVGLMISANGAINVKKTVNVLDPVLTYDEEEGFLTSVDQISSNCVYIGDGTGYEALIDKETSTWFHSSYGESDGGLYPNAKHFLQFDLTESHEEDVVFHFSGRQNNSTTYNDCPNDFVLYGTNDEAIGKSVESATSSWTEIQAYKDLFPDMANSTVCFYTGKLNLKGFRYVRMVVNNTTSGRSEGTYGQHFFTLSQINFYPPHIQDDKFELLGVLLDSINEVNPEFEAGDQIGQVPVELVNAWNDAYLAALEAGPGLSDEEYDKLASDMLNALQACKEGTIRLPGGLYFVINGSPDFFDTQGVQKAWYATADKLRWKTLDKTDLTQIFKFTILDNGNFDIQTVVEDFAATSYVGYQTSTSKDIPMVGSTDAEMIIDALGENLFYICTTKLANGFHPESHSSGAGVSGDIVAWGGKSEVRDQWYLEPCSDEELAAATQKYYQTRLDAELKTVADSAQFVYNKCFTFGYNLDEALITDVDQLLCNAVHDGDGQGLPALIDNDDATFLHTAYSSTYDPGTYHNLQVKFKTPQQKIVMYMRARDTNSNHDTPNDVEIYATNDDELGNDAYSDNNSWTKVTEVIMDVENVSGVEYFSDGIDLGAEYKYFRMVVIHTTDEAAGRVFSGTGLPYYNLSAFQLYPYTISRDNSQYYYIEGMKEAADNVLAVAQEKYEIIANKASTQKDIDEMRAAIKAVTDLVGDPRPFNNLLRDAQALTENAIIGDEIGCVKSDADLEAYKTEIQAAVEQAQLDKPAKVNIEAALVTLQNAIDKFKNERVNNPEFGKWYYIKPLATNGWAEERFVYMNGTSPKYGGDSEGSFIEMNNPAFMWRLEDNGDGTTSIRNMFGGNCIWNGNPDAWNYAGARDTLQRHNIAYVGNGGYFIEAHYEGSATVRRLELYNATGDMTMYHNVREDNRELFTFVPVDVDALTFYINDNYMRVLTLPFAVLGGEAAISELNENVQTYGIHSIEEPDAEGNITKLNLMKKDAFAAGEPMIIVTGNPDAYDSENVTQKPITVVFPEAYDEIVEGACAATSANGLVGIIPSKSIEKAGYGYLSGAQPKVTTAEKITLGRQTGYIDPTQITTAEGDIDLVVEFQGSLDAVKNVKVTTVNGTDNKVYSLDGKFLGTDTKNLNKGIYIVGKKKIAVK